MSDSAILRSAKNITISNFVNNMVDADNTLAANTDQRFTTQKAFKAYADSKLMPNVNGLPETTTVEANDWLLMYDVNDGAAKRAHRSFFQPGNGTASDSENFSNFYTNVQLGAGTHNLWIIPQQETCTRNMWVAGSTLNEARYALGSAGTMNASLVFGGAGASGISGTMEKSDGVVWRTGPGITARWAVSATGLQNSALRFGGATSTGDAGIDGNTEKYDGTTWSSTASLNTSRIHMYGVCGQQNAALAPGGQTGASASATHSNVTEKFDGQSWTATGSLIESRTAQATAGTQNGAVCVAGGANSIMGSAEKFNGTAWSAASALSIARMSPALAGTLSNARCMGGATGSTRLDQTEVFNGMAWTSDANILTARDGMGQSGGAALCQIAGGHLGTGYSDHTEKFYGDLNMTFRVVAKTEDTGFMELESEFPLFTVIGPAEVLIDYVPKPDQGQSPEEIQDVFTMKNLDWGGGQWTSDPSWNLQMAGSSWGSCGSQTTALLYGGQVPGVTVRSERFNNNAWVIVAGGDLPEALSSMGSTGVASAALSFGGNTLQPSYVNFSYKFDGVSWATTGPIAHGKYGMTEAGVMNASLSSGGHNNAGSHTDSETFNGVQWSALNGATLNTTRSANGSTGSRNAALTMGNGQAHARNTSERFNGHSWYHAAQLNVERVLCRATGSVFAALMMGGYDTSGNYSQPSEKYNGSFWIVAPYPIGYRTSCGAVGSQQAAMCFGGVNASSMEISTEKFNTDLPNNGVIATLTY